LVRKDGTQANGEGASGLAIHAKHANPSSVYGERVVRSVRGLQPRATGNAREDGPMRNVVRKHGRVSRKEKGMRRVVFGMIKVISSNWGSTSW